jgi:hypothetical protein
MIRLLNINTLNFREFNDDPPPYAIASHRWGEEEVGFKDAVTALQGAANAQEGRGLRKIRGYCDLIKKVARQVPENSRHRRCEWLSIDMCCTDKSSSAEMTEAINSMFA